MSCSVVIATYNRARLLDECLGHLRLQAFLPGDEVIIVDNGSRDATPQVLRRHMTTFPVPLVCLREEVSGKSRALATGLAAAQGSVLAFTDDDVNVDADWLDSIRSALATPGIDVVGGPVLPRWEGPLPLWLGLEGSDGYGRCAAPLALLNYGSTPAALGPRTLLGANLAVRREVLQRLGGFAPHLGKLRNTLLSGEDHDLCQRAQAAGFSAMYVPQVRVRHWVPRSRMRLRYFVSWFYWSGVTHAVLDHERTGGDRTFPPGKAPLVRHFLSGLAGAAIEILRVRPRRALDRVLDSAFAAGYAAHRWSAPPIPPAASGVRRAA